MCLQSHFARHTGIQVTEEQLCRGQNSKGWKPSGTGVRSWANMRQKLQAYKFEICYLVTKLLFIFFPHCFPLKRFLPLPANSWPLGHRASAAGRERQNFLPVWSEESPWESCVCAQGLSPVRFLATTWTVAHQARLSMRFPRQEYCSRLPFPVPGDLPDTGIKPTSPASPILAGRFFTTEPPGKPFHGKHLKQI